MKAEAKTGTADDPDGKPTATNRSSMSESGFRNQEPLLKDSPARLEHSAVPPELAVGHSADIGHDERFASHNLLVGAALTLWGFVAASGMGGSPDQDGLDSHPTLMSIIDGLQLVAMLTGAALVVSGIGIRSGQRWGLRLATWCAAVFVLSGVVFLAAWQFLRHEAAGGEMVEAVAVMTFVRQNLDLLIGLVDGGALFVFLTKHRAASDGRVRNRGVRSSAVFAQ